MNSVRLDTFDPHRGFDRGRPRWVEGLWYFSKMKFFLSAFPWPSRLKVAILRGFGAKIGKGVYLRPRINIHFPWKLEIGDHCWIGEQCEIHNFERLVIESHVAIAHQVFLTTGGHDFDDPSMPYKNRPSRISRGSWICSCVFVGPGVTIGEHCVVIPGSVVTRDIPEWSIAGGSPAVRVKPRVLGAQ